MQIHCKFDQLLDPRSLKPHPKNRNSHSKEQIERLAKLYEFHGIRHPIIVSNLSGHIVAGHGRREAAVRAKIKEFPVVFQDFTDDVAEYAFIQADNAIALWADLDLAGINADIGDLGPDFDLEMLGIEDFTLDIAEKLEPGCDEDDVPEARPEPKVVRGEVYILGNHRLMCGDSTAITDVERLMNGEKADMVFTDPPYGIKYQNNACKRFDVIENDDKILDVAPVVWAQMKNDSAAFIWTAQSVYPIWRQQFSDFYKSTIIWNKGGGGKGDLKGDFMPTYEMALFCTKGRPTFITKRPPSVWDIGKDAQSEYVHPTQKPVTLVEYGLDCFTGKRSLILDLFGGSGSTLIACEKTDRHCFMMELDPIYCGVILDRWQKFTGKKAHREDGIAWDEIRGAE